jgi:hypothetical protein
MLYQLSYSKLERIIRENPGISDEELARRAETTVESARAYRSTVRMTYEDICRAASSSINDVERLSGGKYREFQKIVRENPGLSDEDLAQKAKVNVATARAYRPK